MEDFELISIATVGAISKKEGMPSQALAYAHWPNNFTPDVKLI